MFRLDDRRFGLPLAAVVRVVRAVAITPLPRAPTIVLGIVNAGGTVVPVIDMRRRLGMEGREMLLTDHLVLARTPRRVFGFLADAVTGVVHCTGSQAISASDVLPHIPYVRGVVKLEDGLVVIQDLDAFLSLEEEDAIDRAMESGG
ncbi:MAG TPA: chemotaxis protein CheW [Thermoanaerobaculia bacterium]|nr:chemotaxis protein CheW [Thermoanaerobaculia bacterium]